MRRGRISLVIGVAFMAACLFLARLYAGTGSNFLREGLTVVSWVALWRPLEIYLYDWWPVREEQRLLSRLARMHVKMLPPPSEKP